MSNRIYRVEERGSFFFAQFSYFGVLWQPLGEVIDDLGVCVEHHTSLEDAWKEVNADINSRVIQYHYANRARP